MKQMKIKSPRALASRIMQAAERNIAS